MITRQRSGEPFRVAILGAGGIAETHAEVLQSIPGVELIAIGDAQFSKAENFRDKFQLAGAYPSLAAMLDEAKPDVVHLPVSPVAHAATAIACLERGVSVFVEKPFTLSTAECARVSAAAARSGAQVGVNHNVVFHPTVLRAIQAVKSGKLGAIEHASFGFNAPMPELPWGPYSHWLFQDTGNLVFELAVHPLSVTQRLFGRILEVKTLASGGKVLPNGVRFYSNWQLAMRCERGTASLQMSVAAGFPDNWIHIQGEDGACHANLHRNTLFLSEKSPLLRDQDDLRDAFQTVRSVAGNGIAHFKNNVQNSLRRTSAYPQYESMKGSICAYYEALSRGAKPPVSDLEGTQVVEACALAVAEFSQPQETRLEKVLLNG